MVSVEQEPAGLFRSRRIPRMMSKMSFDCPYCGRAFEQDVVGLARHIGQEHDRGRQNLQK